jgi:hypothetical protein
MRKKNAFGLTRYIPAPTARAVRQRCGFGCVICGNAVYQYHHFDPPFADACEHHADRITLLCGKCHQDGSITDETIREWNARPVCRKQGYAGNLIQSIVRPLSVRLGRCLLDSRTMIMDEDVTLVGLSPAEEAGTPLRLDARLWGDDGSEVLSIVRNEWRVGVGHYDVTVSGNRVEVRRMPRSTILAMKLVSDQEVHVEHLMMRHKGFDIVCTDDRLTLARTGGGRVNLIGDVSAPVGIWFKAGHLLVGANLQGGACIALA